MTRYYTANMVGPYHLDNDIPCQDSYFVSQKENGVICAACADGLGSELFSDVGSRIASKVAVEYCAEHYVNGQTFEEVKRIMNNAYVYAYKAVLEEAQNTGNPCDEYDTTLCLVIYDNCHVYYGQSGDSGIVALLQSGEYVPVTAQQRDEDGYVFPLCSGPNKWVFGEVEGRVSSVMLMTDGVWEQICPHILHNRENKVNVALASKFMDRRETGLKTIRALEEAAYQYLKDYPRRLLDDDKTIVVIYNPFKPAKKMPDEYYRAPDWEALHEEAKANLYGAETSDEMPSKEDSDASHEVADEMSSERPIELPDETPPDSRSADENASPSDDVPEGEATKKRADAHRESSGEKPHSAALSMASTRRVIAQPQMRTRSNRGTATVYASGRVYAFLSVVILLAFSVLAFAMSSFVKEHAPISYLGVFLVCFIANSTVLLPAPSILVVLEYSQLLNPVAVAICGAFGAALGEMVGFLAGAHGRYLVSRKSIRRIENRFPDHPFIFVFSFAALPLPLFDVVGMLAGAIRLNIAKFFASCLSGKLVKMLMFVWIWQIVATRIS